MPIVKDEILHIADEKPVSRNVRRLRVSAQMLGAFIGSEISGDVAVSGWPVDAEIVGARWDWPGVVELLVTSDSFEPVELGSEIPPMEVRYTRCG